MMQGTDPASLALRDIHLPDPVSWWPPAPGWWILLSLIILIVTLLIVLIRKQRTHRLSAIFLAKKELDRIRNDFITHQDKTVLARDLSELIRRVCISVFPRTDTASLIGKDWLTFLDQYNNERLFSEGVGRALIEAPYQANPEYDSVSLMRLVSSWIDSISKIKKGRPA